MGLELVPISLKEANQFVSNHHRHYGPVAGHKFSIAASDGEKIIGVVIVGRPISRYLDDGWTLEVTRLCTDGTRNACSMLCAAAWRAARAMGYKRLNQGQRGNGRIPGPCRAAVFGGWLRDGAHYYRNAEYYDECDVLRKTAI